MELKRHHYILGFFFVIVLAVRLYFAFQTGNFTGDEAYFNLRQIESIRDTGLPLFQDSLSYGGRTFVFLPLFHYLVAGFSFLMPLVFAAKLIPNIFAALAVIAAYLVALEVTQNKQTSIFVSFISAFIPIYMGETVNSISVHSMTISITLFSLYFFMKINKDRKYVKYFLISMLVLSLTSAYAILVVISLAVYTLLLRTEGIKQARAEVEVTLFSTFFIIWLQALIYRKAFFIHGAQVVMQNIPDILLQNYFSEITILSSIYAIGMVPFILGIYLIYKYLLNIKEERIYLLISFAVVTLILLWLKLMQLRLGLITLGVVLAILFGQFMKIFLKYLDNTKLASHKSLIISSIAIVFVLTSVIPSLHYGTNSVRDAYTDTDIASFTWMSENTPEDSTVIASFENGHLITAVAKRKNVGDTHFLFIRNIDEKVGDIERMYKTNLQTEAIEIMQEYGADYLYFSEKEQEEFGVSELRYISQECFERVYAEQGISIYKSLCRI